MNRRTARENAFIAAFELGFGAQSLEDIIEYSEECGEYALDEFAQKLLRCYLEHAAQADELIRPRLKNWSLERLPRTSRTLLRLAIVEMMAIINLSTVCWVPLHALALCLVGHRKQNADAGL